VSDQLLAMARAANGSELALEAAEKVEPVTVSEALVVLGECVQLSLKLEAGTDTPLTHYL
jgi:hypothetical protein